MSCGIYKIENLINKKVYIGQSINIEKRWQRHKNSNDKYSLHQAFKKYGLKNFSFTILEECKRTELNEKEIYWILYFDSYKKGYNETIGGTYTSPQKLLDYQIEEIIYFLQNTNKSNQEIAKIYNVSENTICGINTGFYRKQDIEYPIRKRKKPKCKKCGKEISYNSTYCRECFKNLNAHPSKEELYNLLKDNKGNFTKVSKLFNVKTSSIRRWCKKYNLPFHSSYYKNLN